MLYSMTGFGKAVAELPGKKICAEIKSLNSKQADISMRIPSSLREYELGMRNSVATALERGKIDVTLTIETTGGETVQALNVAVLDAYKTQVEQVASSLGIPAPSDWYSVLFRFPDVMKADTMHEADDAEVKCAFSALEKAMDSLRLYRRAEGEKLELFFAERIRRIGNLLDEVPKYEGERIAKVRLKMEEGLSNLSNINYDRSRLEQELFFYIEKLDVNEEKQRLAQHLEYFIETMGSESSQGKKLGFIAQEMGREINTLGSKSNHSEMQRLVVQMKDELEQIKEQVLNVL